MTRFFAEVNAPTSTWGPPGLVRSIFPWDVEDAVPEYAPGTVAAIDVTDLDPQPVPGSTYSFESETFTPPPPPPPPVEEPPPEPGPDTPTE